jgi:hypothetical protein
MLASPHRARLSWCKQVFTNFVLCELAVHPSFWSHLFWGKSARGIREIFEKIRYFTLRGRVIMRMMVGIGDMLFDMGFKPQWGYLKVVSDKHGSQQIGPFCSIDLCFYFVTIS